MELVRMTVLVVGRSSDGDDFGVVGRGLASCARRQSAVVSEAAVASATT